MSRASWFLAIPSLLGIGWHALALLRGSSAPARVVACALALATLAHVLRARKSSGPPRGVDTLYAVTAAGVFWSALLEVALERGSVEAFGFVCILTAALFHGVLALRGSPSLAWRSAAQLLLGVLVFGGVQHALAFVLPRPSYKPVADPGSAPDALYRGDDGRVRGTPGFRGVYAHPEFAGVRLDLNQLGLRDGLDEADSPAAGELSVLVLGDSLVWGIGVPLELTFQELLEARADEFSPQPARVYCAGIPGYSTPQARAMLAELTPTVRPQVVVLSVFEDNDLQECLFAQRASEAASKLKRPEQPQDQEIVEVREPERGPLRSFAARAAEPEFWRTLATVNRSGTAHLLTRAGLRDSRARANVFIELCLRRPAPARVTEAREAALVQIRALAAECRAGDLDLIVMVAPAAIQADERSFRAFAAQQTLEPDQTSSRSAFHEGFIEDLRADGFVVVDMLPSLEALTARGVDCYHSEGHWNERGHAAAAEQLIPVLKRVLEAR